MEVNTKNNVIMDFTGMAVGEEIITSITPHRTQMDK